MRTCGNCKNKDLIYTICTRKQWRRDPIDGGKLLVSTIPAERSWGGTLYALLFEQRIACSPMALHWEEIEDD